MKLILCMFLDILFSLVHLYSRAHAHLGMMKIIPNIESALW